MIYVVSIPGPLVVIGLLLVTVVILAIFGNNK